MNVSQTAEYALRAVVCLARHEDSQTTQHIAECTGVPQSYLPKVLQPLTRAKLVSAQRGVRGGYMLQCPSDELTVLKVINCVDPARRIPRCPGVSTEEQGNGLCPLHRLLDQAIESLQDLFSRTTIHQLAFGPDGKPIRCGDKAAPGQTTADIIFPMETPQDTAI